MLTTLELRGYTNREEEAGNAGQRIDSDPDLDSDPDPDPDFTALIPITASV